MRTVTIDRNKVSSYRLGTVGEHNATELVITPSDYITSNENVVSYRVYFKLRNIKDIYKTDAYDTLPIIVPLTQMLTQNSYLSLQVVAFDADGNQLLMDEKLEGFYFDASNYNVNADDISEEMQSEIDQLRAEIGNKVSKVDGKQLSTNDYTDEDKARIDEFAEFAHKHENKEDVLDKFSLSESGNLLFNGDNIGEGSVKDWDENDPSSGEYIKNRTHYSTSDTKYISDKWDGTWESEYKPQVICDIPQEHYYSGELIDTDAQLRVYKVTDSTNIVTALEDRKYNIHTSFNVAGEGGEYALWVDADVTDDLFSKWSIKLADSMESAFSDLGIPFEEAFGMTKEEFIVYIDGAEYLSQEYVLTTDDSGNATSKAIVYGLHFSDAESLPIDFELVFITALENVTISDGTVFDSDVVNITFPEMSLTKGIYCVSSEFSTYAIDSDRERQFEVSKGSIGYANNGSTKQLDIKYIPNEITESLDEIKSKISKQSSGIDLTAKVVGFSQQGVIAKLYDSDGVEIFYDKLLVYNSDGNEFNVIIDYTDIGSNAKAKHRANIINLLGAESPSGADSVAIMYSYLSTEYTISNSLNIGYLLVDSRNTSSDEYPVMIYNATTSGNYNEIKDLNNRQIFELVSDNKPIVYDKHIAYSINTTSTRANIYYFSPDGLYVTTKSNNGSWNNPQLAKVYNVQADFSETDVSSPSYIRNKPVTLDGYGITDAYNKTEIDNTIRDVYVGGLEPTHKESLWVSHDERTASSLNLGDTIILPHTDGDDESNTWICVEKDNTNNTVKLFRKSTIVIANGSLQSVYESGYNNVVVGRVTDTVPQSVRDYVIEYSEVKASNLSGTNNWFGALRLGYGVPDSSDVLRLMIDDEPLSYIMLGNFSYTSNKYYGDNVFFYTTTGDKNYYNVRTNTEILSASGYKYKIHGVITLNGNTPIQVIDKTANNNVSLKYKSRDTWKDLSLGGSSSINYSTEEQDTGVKWIDGSAIYQKTVDVPLGRDLESKINHGISDFNELISIEGTVLTVDQTRGNLYRSFPFVYSGSGGTNYAISIYDFDKTSFMFVRGSAYYTNNTNIGGKFTFRYTKTTD